MLHENIKALARRSVLTDKVIFGESRKAHPLGIDGLNVDLSVDAAMLQLNSSVYDSATSLQIECGNIVSMLKESLNVNVSTGVARLYKESKVAEVIKKVIAYIVKAVKYLFVESPKKIINKIKSMFTKKKSSTGFAEKNKEHMQKTEESIKKTADNLKSSMESKMKDSEFQAWKSEMLKDLNEIGKKMDATSDLDADRATDAIMNA